MSEVARTLKMGALTHYFANFLSLNCTKMKELRYTLSLVDCKPQVKKILYSAVTDPIFLRGVPTAEVGLLTHHLTIFLSQMKDRGDASLMSPSFIRQYSIKNKIENTCRNGSLHCWIYKVTFRTRCPLL